MIWQKDTKKIMSTVKKYAKDNNNKLKKMIAGLLFACIRKPEFDRIVDILMLFLKN